jgi:hypothetical protein
LRRLLRKGVQVIEAIRPIGSATGTVAAQVKLPQILTALSQVLSGALLVCSASIGSDVHLLEAL